jgi:hypothetical protein
MLLLEARGEPVDVVKGHRAPEQRFQIDLVDRRFVVQCPDEVSESECRCVEDASCRQDLQFRGFSDLPDRRQDGSARPHRDPGRRMGEGDARHVDGSESGTHDVDVIVPHDSIGDTREIRARSG